MGQPQQQHNYTERTHTHAHTGLREGRPYVFCVEFVYIVSRISFDHTESATHHPQWHLPTMTAPDIFDGSLIWSPLPLFFLQVLIILVVVRLLGKILHALNQPMVQETHHTPTNERHHCAQTESGASSAAESHMRKAKQMRIGREINQSHLVCWIGPFVCVCLSF